MFSGAGGVSTRGRTYSAFVSGYTADEPTVGTHMQDVKVKVDWV